MRPIHFITTLSLVSLIAPAGWGQSLKLDTFLKRQTGKSRGWSSVIVRSSKGISPQERQQLLALGGDIYRSLPLIHSVALRIPTRKLAPLAALPFVERLSADVTVQKSDEFTVGHSGAELAWSYGFTGDGVGVAVLDSGVAPLHPDLRSRVTIAPNFASDSSSGDPCGHGSHVAGILAGNGNASSGDRAFRTFYGIAPKAKIITVRILDKNGQGSVSGAVAAIQWVITNKAANNIRVLNLSLGHEVGESYKTDPLCQAVEAAWKAGIVVVCAAGNNGRLDNTYNPLRNNEGYGTNYGSIQSPANDPYVITIGAVKNTTGLRLLDPVATYSSRGPSRIDFIMKPDLVAPGNRVISLNSALGFNYLSQTYAATNALPWNSYLSIGITDDSMRYFYLSGTSMAAPVVAGAAALMLQKDPTLTPDTIKVRLMASADKIGSDPNTYGAGLLNIPAALGLTLKPTMSALSPQAMLNSSKTQIVVDPSRAIWGVNGTRAVWGVTTLQDFRAVWGVQAIWGSNLNLLVSSAGLLSDPIWTDQAIWGSTTTQVDLSGTTIFGEK